MFEKKEKLGKDVLVSTGERDVKVPFSVAEKEVIAWLDFKKIGSKAREVYSDNIDSIIDRVVDGTLSFDDQKSILHNVLFPVENTDGVVVLSSLVYKPRVAQREINTAMRGVKQSDSDGRVTGYLSAITGQPKGVLATLDSVDMAIAQNVVVFFLS